MVQILEGGQKKPSFAQRLNTGVGRGLEMGSQLMQQYEQKKAQEMQSQAQEMQMHQENEAFKRLTGEDVSGIRDPKIRQKIAEMVYQSRNKATELRGESEQEQNNYDQVKNTFGKQFADVWKAAPVGGKTELLKVGIDAKLRGHNIEDLLKGVQSSGSPSNELPNEKPPQMKNGDIPKDYQWPDYSKRPPDYTPKEWNNERETWRKENDPIFQSNKTKLKNNINDSRDIKRLSQLNKSKKLPEGMARTIIDPETGDIRPLAQLIGLATPETQEWVKIASRFQNRAKDAFGSRVTNFDLMSYMKQFPGLLNTPEGRDRILEMMTINNELDQLYEKSLNKIYNKYGLSGISQENADRMAQEFIKDDTERLENKYLNIDEQNQMQGEEGPVKLSGKMVDVIGPDGEEYEVDQSEVGLLPEGYKIK